MYFFYNLIIIFLIIILSPIILTALILVPKFRAGFWQKAGFYKKSSKETNSKTILVHAVSVGEVIAVEKFIKTLRTDFPNDKIIISTVTKTGNNVAKQKLRSIVDEIVYFPFDLCFAVKSFIKNLQPDMVIIAETEIWPYFVHSLKKQKIPCLIINGRISPHSYNGYKKLSWFFKPVLNNYTNILMQTQDDLERIVDIGANPDTSKLMGNLKFDIDGNIPSDDMEKLKADFQTEQYKVMVAGSTHTGEDEIVLKMFKNLKVSIPDLKMILAPRHPERLKSVEQLLTTGEFKYSKRSLNSNFNDNDIILLDTMGELSKMYSIADIAFIGGSFSSTGGHNPLEASIFNVPVISGPSVFNFKDIYKFLTESKAAFVVDDEKELETVCTKLLTDKEFYEQSSLACKTVFNNNRGAINNALHIIKEILK